VIVNEHIPWQDLPGYRKLLKAFLIEIKKREITEFPEALKEALYSLTIN